MNVEEEHPQVLTAKSAFHISKNVERIANSLEKIELYLTRSDQPSVEDAPLTLWGRGPEK